MNIGKELARFLGKHRHFSALGQFTPDRNELILNDGASRVSYWNVQANKESRSLQLSNVFLLSPDARSGVGIEVSKDGGAIRSQLTVLDLQKGKETNRLPLVALHNGVENGIAFAPDGKTLAVVHEHREIQVREFPSSRLRVSFPLPDSAKYRVFNQVYWQYQLSFSADGRTVLLGTKAGLVHRWDLVSRKELPTLSKHTGEVAGVHVLPGGKTMVTTGADGLIRRWDVKTGRQLSEPPGYAGRTHAAFSPDGHIVAVGDASGRLELWNARSGGLLRVLRRDGPGVGSMAFTPDGKELAEVQTDNTVQFWAVLSGEKQRLLRFDTELGLFEPLSLTFTPDGRRRLLGRCQRPRLYDLSSGKDCWRSNGYLGPSVFSRDGKTLLSTSGPHLNFLDAASGKTRFSVRLKTDTPDNLGIVVGMAVSPDGQRLAVGLVTGAVYLCDARTGEEITHFQAIEEPKGLFLDPGRKKYGLRVDGLSFSPNSKWLCTSGADGSVRLWEVVTGREVLRLSGHKEYGLEIAFGVDNSTVLSCGNDAQAYLWSLRPPMGRESKPSLDSLWSDLAGSPAKAYRALWIMSDTKEASAFLRGKLYPVQPVSDDLLRKLIADLESAEFAVREKATKALAEFGDLAVPVMRETLRSKPPLETRKRLDDLLERVANKGLSVDELRIVRAIDVLERQGSPEARELLRILAAGAPRALLTMEARAALSR